MQKGRTNIYRLARDAAKISRYDAAESLHVSVRSLVDYETGHTTPPDDVVCLMVQTYRTPWLAYHHLQTSTEVGRRYLPRLDLTDLARCVLRFQKEVGDIDTIKGEMVELACDGAIETSETTRWATVTREIQELAGAALSVVFSA
jgi:transcriptional regulator with XRE-family HTH domain